MSSQGKYTEAEPLLARATELSEKRLGPDHATVATMLDHLVEVLKAQVRVAGKLLGKILYA